VPESDYVLTRHEAARAAGVTFNTIQLWIRAGRLHPMSEPGPLRRVIRLSELRSAVTREESLGPAAKRVWR
jgi:hypothetical protein